MQEFDLDFSENSESKIARRVTGSLESILIEHTESDEISNVNLLNEEKNLTGSEMQFSKKIDDNFTLLFYPDFAHFLAGLNLFFSEYVLV